MSDFTVANGTKLERKWLAHFIDDTFGGTGGPHYGRLGKDLESYAVEMNPDVEQKRNIIGENTVTVKGYEPHSSVESFYAYVGDPLYEQLNDIVNTSATGTKLKTTVIDATLEYNGETITVIEAYKEDVYVVPQSIGGEDGVQIPFDMYYAGNRTAVSGTITNGVFTIGS